MHESSVSVRVVHGLVDAVVAAGVDRQRFLAAAQINALMYSDDVRVPRSRMLELCELALDMTGDAAFGLHWGERFNDSTFTPLSHLISHSPNLRTGFETLFAYQRLMTDEMSYELVEEGEHVSFQLSSVPTLAPRLRRFIVEMEAVGIYRLMRTFGANVGPERVRFAYAAPDYHSEYLRIFQGVECVFDQPHSSLIFSRALMNNVPPNKDDEVRSALQSIASRRVLRLTKSTPYAVRSREEIVKLGPRVRSDMGQVARALGMSVRSLRRRLEAEGASFNAIVNEAAAMIAKDLLEIKQKTIQETAFEMGFADAAGFHRAFKRWTGLTPRTYLESDDRTSDGDELR
jgi:AraC-like DNA-binding protein